MNNKPYISIILPCRNKEDALPHCLKKIKEVVTKKILFIPDNIKTLNKYDQK